MDFSNFGGNMPDLGGLTGGGAPDISSIMQSLEKPQYELSKEYGSQRDSKFNALSDYDLPNLEIRTLVVRSGAILDGISVVYADGSTVHHGGQGGSANTIHLNGEIIQKISGCYDVNFGGRKTISGLRITLGNGRTYGSYGSWGNNTFEIFKDGHRIVGFFGSTDGGFISSFGAYLMK